MTGDREYIIKGIRRLKGRTFKALLGKGDSGHTVDVAGKANYAWIRVKYGSSLGAPVQALNRNVPPIHGRVVRVKEIDRAGIKGYEIIDFDDTGTPYYHDDTGHNVLPKHGWTHECSQDAEATDPVNLYTRCWAELRVEPTDPCSLYGYVTHGWYMCDAPQWFSGGNTPLFVPPAAGTSRYDLVYIDCSGTIGITQGDNNMPALGGPLPEPPDFTIPLAAIEFTGTVGCIQENMILDCRVMPNLKYPPGSARFDDSISPAAVASVNWTGVQDYPSRADHWHQGVHSFSKVGDALLYGDVTISGGAGVVLTQAGQNVEIECTGTAGEEGPEYGCRVYNNANQSIPDSIMTALAFDSEYYDTYGMHNTVLNNTRITVQNGGKYTIGGSVVFAANAVGVRALQIYKNNSTILAQEQDASAGAANTHRTVVVTSDEFVAGDYVELRAYQSSGGALNVNYEDRSSPVFWAQKATGFSLTSHDHSANAEGGQLDWDNIWADAAHTHQAAGEGGTLDHGLALTGLLDDDHTQYLKERLSGGAAAEVPIHKHDAAEGGQLDWDDIWSDATHDHSAAGEGGNALNPNTLNVATDATVGDDLTVGDHAWMATGTCAGNFNIGGLLQGAGVVPYSTLNNSAKGFVVSVSADSPQTTNVAAPEDMTNGSITVVIPAGMTADVFLVAISTARCDTAGKVNYLCIDWDGGAVTEQKGSESEGANQYVSIALAFPVTGVAAGSYIAKLRKYTQTAGNITTYHTPQLDVVVIPT